MSTEVHSAFGEFLYMFGSFILNVHFGVRKCFSYWIFLLLVILLAVCVNGCIPLFLLFYFSLMDKFYQVRETRKMHCFAICSDWWMGCIIAIVFWKAGLIMRLFKQIQIKPGKTRHNVHKVMSDVCMCICSEMLSQHCQTKMCLKLSCFLNVNCIRYYNCQFSFKQPL